MYRVHHPHASALRCRYRQDRHAVLLAPTPLMRCFEHDVDGMLVGVMPINNA